MYVYNYICIKKQHKLGSLFLQLFFVWHSHTKLCQGIEHSKPMAYGFDGFVYIIIYVRTRARTYVRMYVCMYVHMYVCKYGSQESCAQSKSANYKNILRSYVNPNSRANSHVKKLRGQKKLNLHGPNYYHQQNHLQYKRM